MVTSGRPLGISARLRLSDAANDSKSGIDEKTAWDMVVEVELDHQRLSTLRGALDRVPRLRKARYDH
jgi:hypothetical protein